MHIPFRTPCLYYYYGDYSYSLIAVISNIRYHEQKDNGDNGCDLLLLIMVVLKRVFFMAITSMNNKIMLVINENNDNKSNRNNDNNNCNKSNDNNSNHKNETIITTRDNSNIGNARDNYANDDNKSNCHPQYIYYHCAPFRYALYSFLLS